MGIRDPRSWPGDLMRAPGAQARGIIGALRLGRVPARALAIADSRSLVRSLFLASAARVDVLPYLRHERRFSELVDFLGATRPERLRAWLSVGSELGEVRHRGERYRVRGHRASAIAGGDPLLTAHYRSMLEYQVGPYGDLEELLRSDDHHGREDLDRYAADIAQVSLAAAPFVSSFVRDAVTGLRPSRVLDVGCGTGFYSKVVLGADPKLEVDGIDLAEDVIGSAREDLQRQGYASRVRLHVGDVRRWASTVEARFDLVLLLNNIYYFDRESRADLYRQMGEVLTERGQILIVSMTAPGSIAAAHLHFMLTCQAAHASLPVRSELEGDLSDAGFAILADRTLVPTEPFVGIRAARC